MKTQNNKHSTGRQSLFEDNSPLTPRQETLLVFVCGFAILGMLSFFIGVAAAVYLAFGQ